MIIINLPCSSCPDLGVIGVLVMDTWSGFQDLFLWDFDRFRVSSAKGVSPIPKTRTKDPNIDLFQSYVTFE